MSVTRTTLQTFPIPNLPGYESRLVKVEFPPGASVPLHNHPVAGNGIVFSGDYISHYAGGKTKRFTTGDPVEDLMGTLHLRAENANQDRPLVIVLTYVIPPGENITFIPPEDVPPATTTTTMNNGTTQWWGRWMRLS